tara:strand:+ start:490 stop:1095 length:606 start_codon:yes stop_codon:yes gene_type:complete
MSKFTIDGKDWSYRDPNQNLNTGTTRRGTPGQYTGEDAFMDGYTKNSNSYNWSNPLYEYDRKTVEDAGKATGIQNVNKKEEVDTILDYIKSQNEDKKEMKDTPKKDPKPPAPAPSENEVKAEEFKNQKIAEIKERLAAPPIDIYENYAGKDDLIARNAFQSKQSNAKSPDDDESPFDKQEGDQDFLQDYIFKSKSKNQFVG